MIPTLNPKLIHDADGLNRVMDELLVQSECAIDTEADSMHHYSVRLCLVQLKVAQKHYVVDPLGGLDLQPLWRTPAMQHLVLHGADYDLRMMHSTYGVLPQSVFDTMIASRFLGEERVGLANLVEKFFGVTLSKTNQKADWTLRPLPDHMLEYAALDTEYLLPLRDLLTERLRQEGKLEWVQATCDQLIESVRTQSPKDLEPKSDRWRVKGSSRLYPRELCFLETLWNWRELEAEGLDRPPFKVMGPDLMIDCARAAASDGRYSLPRLPRNFTGERLARFENALARAAETPADLYPPRKPRFEKGPPSPDAALVEHLREARDRAAAQHRLDPTLLANRSQLLALAQPPRKQWDIAVQRAGLLPWQWELISSQLSL